MKKIPYYEIHAFATEQLGGNPAGVCPLAEWLPDSDMQAIAAANNLSETVFFVQQSKHCDIRYFTPNNEVDLCGHGTFASAWLLFEKLGFASNLIEFHCRAGKLFVCKKEDELQMSLPALPYQPISLTQALQEGLSILPNEIYKSTYDLLCVYEHASQIENIEFGSGTFKDFSHRGIIFTAPGSETDIYSRCFYPNSEVFEDPVTGSAHAVLAPFWLQKLNKPVISAEQGLRRRGRLQCEVLEDRVYLFGTCRLYLEGIIYWLGN